MQTDQTTEEQFNPNSELGNLGVKDLFFKYIRFLPLFILSLAFALFGAYLYLRYATPIYKSSGAVMIKNDQTGGGGKDDKLDQLISNDGTKNIQNEIELLRSRPLMQRAVDSLNLQVSYNAVGKIKSPDIYTQGPFLLKIFKINDSSSSFTLNVKFKNENVFIINNEKAEFTFNELFQNRFGVFSLIKNQYASVGKEYDINWSPATSVASSLIGGLQVAPKPNTGILNISVESTNPKKCSDIINMLMIVYGEMTKEDKKTEGMQTLSFIDVRLDTLQGEIDSIQRKLLRYKIENNLINPATQSENYFREITESDRVINESVLEVNKAEAIEDYLADKKNKFSTVPTSLGIQDVTLNAMIMDYNNAQFARKRLIDGLTPENNPRVIEVTEQIEKLRQNILESLKNVKASLGLTISILRKRGYAAQEQAKALPPKIKEQEEIETLLGSKMNLFKFLMEKREETSISLASTTPNSKIIDKAYPNYTPVKPNKNAIQLLAILIGIGLPGLFIFMLEVVNDKINTRYDIEKITQAAILGEVGHSFAENTLVVNKTNRSMVAEQFRIIRSNLQYVLNKIEKPVIMVTSSFSGEGKSFISTNVGGVMALAGKKTIVLEFDIRKPKIMSGLGLQRRAGITNFLLGKSEMEGLPLLVPGYDNLFVLSCGPVPPNPSELLLDPKLDEMFVWLKNNFDVIIIDTAPVGMVSDAMTLGKFANCTLYIVRQGHTYKKQIGLIDEFYRNAKLPKVSIIINDVKIKPGYGYYGYGRYGYGYGYSSGYSGYYEEEHPPKSALTRFFEMFSWKKIKRKFRKRK